MTTAVTNNTRILHNPAWLPLGILVGLGLLVICLLSSITLGAADITAQSVFDALFRYNPDSFDHLIIRTVRLPRVLAGVVIGVGLAVSGAILQGLTSNPLASPSILGISSGAAFAVVLGVVILGAPPLTLYAIFAMIGATVAAVIVYTLASFGRGGATPLKLTLSGVIFTAFISAFTTFILVFDRDTFDQIRFWTVGSLSGRDMEMVAGIAPFVAVGLLGAMLLARQITTISLGQDVAKGLGQNTLYIRILAGLMVVLMAGASVALAGPVAFVGLIIPHMVRPFVGFDYRWIIPYTAIAGAMLVTVADALGRVIVKPQEVPIGVMLAFVGAPFFIYLARSKVTR